LSEEPQMSIFDEDMRTYYIVRRKDEVWAFELELGETQKGEMEGPYSRNEVVEIMKKLDSRVVGKNYNIRPRDLERK